MLGRKALIVRLIDLGLSYERYGGNFSLRLRKFIWFFYQEVPQFRFLKKKIAWNILSLYFCNWILSLHLSDIRTIWEKHRLVRRPVTIYRTTLTTTTTTHIIKTPPTTTTPVQTSPLKQPLCQRFQQQLRAL